MTLADVQQNLNRSISNIYQLYYKSPTALKEKLHFKNFYSGGPEKNQYMDYLR